MRLRRGKLTVFSVLPFFPTGIGVAEPRLEAVMRAERREQPRLGNSPVVPAVADSGGVVEHRHDKGLRTLLEIIMQPLVTGCGRFLGD